MGWEPGIGFVIVANLLLFAVAVAGFLYAYRRTRSDGHSSKEAWYEEADSLAQEVRTTARSVETPIDREEVQRDIVPLAPMLKSHARDAPRGVDAGLVQDVHELGVACYEVGMEHTTHRAVDTGVFIDEKLETLAETAADLEAAVASRY